MKNRILFFALFVLVFSLLFGAEKSLAQNRRGEPNVLSTGYYVVDSDDNAPLPWRPNYFFLDTLYQPFSWYRIKSGQRQFFPGDRPWHYFYNTLQMSGGIGSVTMDTTDDPIAGPIPIGFRFDYYGEPNPDGTSGPTNGYDSVFISANGYIGFRPRPEVAVNGQYSIYSASQSPDLLKNPAGSPPCIIAALFADMDFRPTVDTSKVYIRTSPGVDSFFVSYFNLRLRDVAAYSGNQTNFNFIENGAGRDRLFEKKLQIVFTRNDSSIQVNYGAFSGSVQGFPPVQAYRIFQRNSTIGVINTSKTQSTSVNYGSHVQKGRWDAINATCRSCNKDFRQQGQYAVKFKRWHNVVRANSVDFPFRNYEICLSTSLSPQATFQWLGNSDAAGNIILSQTFKVKFQIRNAITGVAVYGRTFIPPPFTFAGQKYPSKPGDFAPYNTNPYILTELGTFNACAIATSYDQNDNYIGDLWPFDDTACTQIYGIRTTSLPFNDPSDGYAVAQWGNIPDPTKWVAIGATVDDGDAVTFDPPPPRYEAQNGGVGQAGMLDPVIHFDRQDIYGNNYAAGIPGSGHPAGDTLVSFPFNMLGFTKATLAFSFERAGYQTYPWFWDSQALIGPEPTVLDLTGVVVGAAPAQPQFGQPATNGYYGDSLVVEFKLPTAPACNPGLSATGAVLATPAWTKVAGFDGGHDFEFHKYSVRLDQFTTPTFNYFTNAFRFRIRESAYDDGFYPPDDDADDFYIDNISLQVPRKPEIEVMWVRVVTPYTHIPPSQAVALPVYVHLANNSTDVAIAFPVRVQILDPNGNTVYWALETVTSLKGGTDTTILMPNWNAQDATQGGQFIVHAFLASSSYDSYTQDNGTYTRFWLDVGAPGDPPEFALDNGVNAWPGIVQITGAGIGFIYSDASLAMKFRLSVKDTMYGVRVYFANGDQSPGPIRLTVLKGSPTSAIPSCDTVFGAQMEDVRKGQLFNQYWAYYFPKPVILPGGTGAGGTQGVYWISVSQLSNVESYFMGADISRGGGQIVASGLSGQEGPPKVAAMYNDPFGTNYGANNNFGDVSTSYAVERIAGSCDWNLWMPQQGGWWPANSAATANYYFLWWYGSGCDACKRASAGGGQFGANPPFGGGFTLTYFNNAGTYNPMIRPMVSQQGMLPVNFQVPLTGKEVNGAALLNWTTAQEKNNQGFQIQRRIATEADGLFENIGFVDGKINSNTSTGYSYTDRNVTPATYTYRLIQQDLDGSQHVSNTVNVTIGAPGSYELDQNIPNPGVESKISFSMPLSGPTRLVVYNALGQAVRTLVDGDMPQGLHTVSFDGRDDAGNELASGNYIYRFQSGDFTATRKLTLTR